MSNDGPMVRLPANTLRECGHFRSAAYFIDFEIRILSGSLIDMIQLIGPSVDDGIAIEFIHGGDDAVLEFLFGCDADVAQDGAGELGKEALDEVEPGAVLGCEGEFEAARGLLGEPG